MTFSSPSRKTAAILLAGIWTTLSFGAALSPTPAVARDNTPHYRAELAAPAKDARVIAGGVVWNCEGTTCTAPKAGSRDVVMCARLKRATGDVVAFTTGQDALEQADIDRCNR